ncbi:MAG: oligosaccharide flippase family protein, partial [Nitrosomonadales bacterium]|nr:oligosaccharide flippase family protein [Nitrosomonadales bacterium]
MSIKKNVIANFLGQGWTALMGLAFIPIYIQYLGVEAWGLVGFMTMLQAWMVLLDMGLSPAISREMARFKGGAHTAQTIRNLLRSLEVIYFLVAIVIALLMWAATPLIVNNWLTAQKLTPLVITQAIHMMVLVLAGRMLEQVYRGVIQGL